MAIVSGAKREGDECYRAYRLSVASELHLPELPTDAVVGRAADVCIRVGRINRARTQVRGPDGRACWLNGSEAHYVVEGVAAFLVAYGETVTVEPFSCVNGQLLRLSLLGPVMALVLQHRGKFVLHAGAVVIGDVAVGFLGGHGWGKSTLVAMLYAQGHRFLCEDVAALAFARDEIQVTPSFPQFKLWPDAAERLGWFPADFPQVHLDCEKRLIRFRDGFESTSKPLRRLYVLRVGPRVAVERLRPVERLEEVLRHWYGARFGPEFLRSLNRREYFLDAAALARRVPVRILRRPPTFHQDPDLAKVIEGEILRDLADSDE